MAGAKRRRAATDPIETANAKTDADFVRAYLEPGAPGLAPWTTAWTHPTTGQAYRLSLARAACVGAAALDACYALIEQTSRADYEASTQAWRPAHKQAEMREADLRYIVVQADGEAANEAADEAADGKAADEAANSDVADDAAEAADASAAVAAFTSLMPTYEAGQPVVYCYEIHLQPHLRGTGLGALLLGFQSVVAHNLPPVAKVMLTCFVANARALRFYRKQGFAMDPSSPPARTLRSGRTVVPDYVILSRPVRRGADREAV